ncbi:arginase family protein [Colletotrichum incanum]|uniref:Arginase family protein n=1 Tax=Colletotrichum incanum TaxID=1573173 RepID=A0A166NXZ2_COLIC|nr:arginase family protein [Colletotrichum incanum]
MSGFLRQNLQERLRFRQVENDGAVDDDDDAEEGPPRPLPEHDYKAIYKWWNDEYRLLAVCIFGAIALGIIFQKFDNKVVPQMKGDIDFDVIIVAMFTCVRVAMSGIVESHLACVGALIVVLTHGLEASSQQLYRYEGRPIEDKRPNDLPILAPPRSDLGILSADITELDVECSSTNCTWPIMPTLAVCGECNTLNVRTMCTDKSQTCLYSLPSGTSVAINQNAPATERFRTASSPGIYHRFNSTSQTYISVFDVLSVMKTRKETKTIGQECALWFCMMSYDITVTESRSNQTITSIWNTTQFETSNSAHGDEYVFVNIPADMNVLKESRYSISRKALAALRRFVDPLVDGTYEKQYTIINFSSDWAEGMYNARRNLPLWIYRFSLSLTNEVRLNGQVRGKQRYQYGGRAYKVAQMIIVEWKWLLFPTGLIIISIYYLFHTIIRGARDGISVWKSDSLPMLFCRIDTSILARVGDGMDVPNGLDDAVGEVKVCLLREDDGDWVFKPIESEESSSESDAD